MKSIPYLTLVLFILFAIPALAENVGEAGKLDDEAADKIYRDYYANQGLSNAVQAGVAFRGALEANTATADGIARARTAYMPAATQELDHYYGKPAPCYRYSAGTVSEVPCNAAPIQQAGNSGYTGTFTNETKGEDSTTASVNIGRTLQNRPYSAPKKSP